jgi:hypothetical protein
VNGRIILQDISTRLYMDNDHSWTRNCQEAKSFEQTYHALLEGLSHKEKRLQVVWCFQNPTLNMYVAVHPEDNDRIHACVSCPLEALTHKPPCG